MILLVDNYDSFTFNLYQYLGEIDPDIRVLRNDAFRVEEVDAWRPSHIVISPGPGTPLESGVSIDLIRSQAGRIPILGVCLGHQAIAVAYGGTWKRAAPVHGKATPIRHDGTGLFAGLPDPVQVGRYHSLVVDRETLPAGFQATAWTDDGLVMGLRHERMPLFGVQFHPESILTEHGKALLRNFLRV